ncbi:MAG: potassium channel protein [Planctomycetota bacterium]|jgi:voltage-gated potassium channel|nr:potassium channel protein [Planctomycetota bacterium]MDP7250265.1 potassium channel protein [Planctomycetota bacterium]
MLKHLDETQQQLIKALLMVFLVFVLGTIGFKILAPEVPDGNGGTRTAGWLTCIYMTIISLTTVGYGESVPVQDDPALMVFTSLLLLSGIGVLTYFFGTLTAFFIEGSLTHVFRRRKMKAQLSELEDHFIVCGAGETSINAIRELHTTSRPFTVIDIEESQLEELHQRYEMPYILGDASEEELLEEAGIARAKGLLACLPTDKDNLFLVLTAKQMNDKLRIIAKVQDPSNNQKFLKHGADGIASPQVIGGMRLVSEMIRPHVVSFLDIMLRDKDRTMRIEEVLMAEDSSYAGRSLKEASYRQKFKMQVLAILPPGLTKFNYTPDADEPIRGGSTLVVLGEADNVAEMRKAVEGD